MLVGLMRLDPWAAFSMVASAWSASCANSLSFGLIVGVHCFVVFLGELPGLGCFLRVTHDMHDIIFLCFCF